MKVIFVVADSLRRDHVSPYGAPAWGPIQTPSFERFSAMATVFDRAYIGSFPTVPNRRDVQLGHGDKGMPFNRWKCLDADEPTFLRELSRAGVPSMLILDTQNNVTGNGNLQRDFSAWALNRGQEGDPCWLRSDVPVAYPVPAHLIRYREAMWHQVLMNRAHRREETDWFAPGTYALAIKWLEQNCDRESFFLWLDTFDPHEPWDPPQHYLDMYDPGYDGRVFDAPTYGVRSAMGITDRELQHVRARYAAEVTMVDTWFGRLLDKVEELGLLDDTVIILTSDHGTCFDGPGDLGLIQKAWQVGADGMLMSAGRPPAEPRTFLPLAPGICRIPLLVRVPGCGEAQRSSAIVQPWDLTATFLDLFGIDKPGRMIGQSLLPAVEGMSDGTRAAPVMGTGTWGGQGGLAQVMTERWLYTVWRGERPCCLFDLQADPNCESDVAAAHPAVLQELHAHVVAHARGQGLSDDWVAGYGLAGE